VRDFIAARNSNVVPMFDVTLQRVPSIKKKSTAKLPTTGFRYTVARGQTSIKGVNGPPV